MTGLPLWLSDAFEAIERQGTSYHILDSLTSQVLERGKRLAESRGAREIRLIEDRGEPAP